MLLQVLDLLQRGTRPWGLRDMVDEGLGHWGSGSVPGPVPSGPIQHHPVLWFPAPLTLSTLPGLPMENVKEITPSGVIWAGLLLPTSSLGWEDQREHGRLL